MKKGFFITATDTDAGKTVVTAALLRALTKYSKQIIAFKPIQTGCFLETINAHITNEHKLIAPDTLVYQNAIIDYIEKDKTIKDKAIAEVVYPFSLACSPHLAAQEEGVEIKLDSIIQTVTNFHKQGLFTLVEGAGGVYVPLNQTENILDLIRLLNLDVILVTANKVGVINHTLLTVNALRNAGINIAAIFLNTPTAPCDTKDLKSKTDFVLSDNLNTIRTLTKIDSVYQLSHYKNLMSDQKIQDNQQKTLADWDNLAQECMPFLNSYFDTQNTKEKNDALDLAFDHKHLWHPYTSATKPLTVYPVDKTLDTHIYLEDNTPLIDGMSSWWCAIHGYSSPRLVAALQKQAGKMSHVMFGGLTHKPVIELGQKLLKLVPNGLEHIFFADSGSVSVEVALKMALQYWNSQDKSQKNRFLVPLGGYHGDTLGAMSVCDPVNGMHSLFTGMLAKQIFISRPTCAFSESFDSHSTLELEEAFEKYHEELAGIILEPIVQGAGGMWFYHPEYLKKVRELCNKYNVLLIADEIATGFGRTGKMFASEWANIQPDILCIGKALTAGYLTLAATLTTPKIAHGISEKGGVFMHGPTFMANPLACAVANENINMLLESDWKSNVIAIEQQLKQELVPCSNNNKVKDVRVLGAIGVVEMKQAVDLEAMQKFFVNNGVWVRPFGKLIYLMPAYSIKQQDLTKLTQAVFKAIEV